jgi:hypothetical protein
MEHDDATIAPRPATATPGAAAAQLPRPRARRRIRLDAGPELAGCPRRPEPPAARYPRPSAGRERLCGVAPGKRPRRARAARRRNALLHGPACRETAGPARPLPVRGALRRRRAPGAGAPPARGRARDAASRLQRDRARQGLLQARALGRLARPPASRLCPRYGRIGGLPHPLPRSPRRQRPPRYVAGDLGQHGVEPRRAGAHLRAARPGPAPQPRHASPARDGAR